MCSTTFVSKYTLECRFISYVLLNESSPKFLGVKTKSYTGQSCARIQSHKYFVLIINVKFKLYILYYGFVNFARHTIHFSKPCQLAYLVENVSLSPSCLVSYQLAKVWLRIRKGFESVLEGIYVL